MKYLVLVNHIGDTDTLITGFNLNPEEVGVQDPLSPLESYPPETVVLVRPFGDTWTLRNCPTVRDIRARRAAKPVPDSGTVPPPITNKNSGQARRDGDGGKAPA